MPFFTSAELTNLRGTVTESQLDTCTIERATQASDGQGGRIDTWANLATGVRCRIRRAGGGQETEIANRLTSAVPWTIVLPYTQDVLARDRIVVTSQATTRRFEVLAVLALDSVQVDCPVLCEELL